MNDTPGADQAAAKALAETLRKAADASPLQRRSRWRRQAADMIEALQRKNAELRRVLEHIAESHDAGRSDGLPEPCPAYSDVEMWLMAQEALARKETP